MRSRCWHRSSSSRSASFASLLLRDGYHAARYFASVKGCTGYKCSCRYLLSIATSGPRLCSSATAMGRDSKRALHFRRPHLNRFGSVLHNSPLDLLRAGYAQTPVVCLVGPVDRHNGGELQRLIPRCLPVLLHLVFPPLSDWPWSQQADLASPR